MRTLSIHIDRLASALAAKGVTLKRHNLLEVAAAAFGYHTQNQFSAAARNGELDPPAATALGSTTAAGKKIVILQDPDGRPFCMDEEAMIGNRLQSFAVTPYGGLVDLRGISDVEPLEETAAPEIHYAAISHEYGSNLYQDTTRAGLDRQIADWCREYWETEGVSEPLEDLSDEGVIEVYFSRSEREGVTYFDEMKPPMALSRHIDGASPHVPEGFSFTAPYLVGRVTGSAEEPFLYWSNDDGWGHSASATVFSAPMASWPGIDVQPGSMFVTPLPRIPAISSNTERTPEIEFLTNRDCDVQGPEDRAEEAMPWIDAEEIDVGLGPVRMVEIGYAALVDDEVFLAPTVKAFHYDAPDPVRALMENRMELRDYADEIEPVIKAVGGIVSLEEDVEAVTLTIYIPVSEACKAADLECWKEALQDLITPKGHGPRIYASFRPQTMIGGGCYDADPLGETRIDVTYEIKLMGMEAALEMADTDDEAEALTDSIRSPSWITGWHGPFSIEVQEAIEAYYAGLR